MIRQAMAARMLSVAFFLGFLIAAGAESPFECPKSAIFVFGDSLTDTGNIEYLGFNYLNFPYGESYYFPGSINPSRFSDGRLVIDFFGKCLQPCMPRAGIIITESLFLN